MPVFGLRLRSLHASRILVNCQRPRLASGRKFSLLGNAVLPRMCFCYVATCLTSRRWARVFVLQGARRIPRGGESGSGFHQRQFPRAGKKPEVIVHEHCGSRRDRRRTESVALVAQWSADDFCRLGRGPEN